VLGAVALLGIGGAIAAVAVNSTGDGSHVTAPTQAADTVKMSTPPAKADVKIEAQSPVSHEPPPPPITPAQTPTVKADTPTVKADSTPKDTAPKVTRPKQTLPKQTGQAATTTTKTIPKKDPAEVKKDAAGEAPPKPKCDPFASM